LEPLLPFAQLDFAGAPSLAEGRYLARPVGDTEAKPDVMVVRQLGAARAGKRLRKGKPVPLESEPGAEPLPLSRLTLIKARPFESEASAADWLDQVLESEAIATALIREVSTALNRAILAYRVSAPDAYASDLNPADAQAVRFGYGTGQEVAEGRWTAASELPEGRRRSLRAEVIDGVGAQERIAAVLGGRDEIGPAESLLVDAERATAEGRLALAAITLGAAVEALERTGVTPEGDISAIVMRLRERALAGGEVDPDTLKNALRPARRAIRASLRR
jgi:hypothetical protein